MIRKTYIILTPVIIWGLFYVLIYGAFTGRNNTGSLVLLLLAASTAMAISGIFLFAHLLKKEKLRRNLLCFSACLFDIVFLLFLLVGCICTLLAAIKKLWESVLLWIVTLIS
jgi:uncharacterized membrane protein